MEDEILTLAKRLGGAGCDETALAALCNAAQAELAGRLREGVSPADCGRAFPLAAAWLALAKLYTGEAGVEQFSAGNLTIRQRDGAARGAALRLQAEQVLKEWLRDDGFVFWGVKG